MVKILSNVNSVFNRFLAELRDKNVQKDSLRFRKNLERVGEIFAYEISKVLTYGEENVETPLGFSLIQVPAEQIVLATILRAGLPMHQGMLNIFDKAENAFISAYRKYHKDSTFNIEIEYISSPSLDDKILILADPMLATGASIHLAYQALLEYGTPKHTHLVSIIACREGIEFVQKHFNQHQITIWAGAVDDELTAKAYIVPGLGDAGDLAYGCKN